jgi:hypothetical protein
VGIRKIVGITNTLSFGEHCWIRFEVAQDCLIISPKPPQLRQIEPPLPRDGRKVSFQFLSQFRWREQAYST